MPRGKQKQEPILHTCSECEYMYYPDKDYVNYRLYLNIQCIQKKAKYYCNEILNSKSRRKKATL